MKNTERTVLVYANQGGTDDLAFEVEVVETGLPFTNPRFDTPLPCGGVRVRPTQISIEKAAELAEAGAYTILDGDTLIAPATWLKRRGDLRYGAGL